MLENFNSKQRKIIIIILIVVLIGTTYIFLNKKNNADDIYVEENILLESNTTEEKKIEDIIIVHITGGVKKPGIVKLNEGSRIEDAIKEAGGLTEDADISNVNLAYVLEDGIKIKIPKSSEIGDLSDENIINNGMGEGIEDETQEKQDSYININKATENELSKLPGIGISLASKIVEYRNKNGKFTSIEDIKNVNGIGENKYENIKNYIKVK